MRVRLLLIGLMLAAGGVVLAVFRDRNRISRWKRVFNVMFYALLVIYAYVFVKLFLLPMFVKN